MYKQFISRIATWMIVFSLISCKTPAKKNVEPEVKPIIANDDNKTPGCPMMLAVVDSVPILESSIIYDENFNPLVYAKIKNNLTTVIIAFELQIQTNTESGKLCSEFIIKKKLKIVPKQTIIIKDPISKEDIDKNCNLDRSIICLGDFILSTGKKTSLNRIFWENFH